MRHAVRLAAILLAGTALPALAEDAPIRPESVRAHVEFLANDLLEGRDAGTRGYDIAARYVASQFDALGLKPGVEGGWYQTIAFQSAALDPAKPAGMTIGGTRFANGDDVIVTPDGRAPDQALTAPAVFVGYGLEAPERKIDDYAGLDVKGKWVVLLYGTPKGLPGELAAHLGSSKNKVAEAHGAIGVITLATPELLKSFPWDAIKRERGHPIDRMIEPDGKPLYKTPGIQATGLVGGKAADALFAGAARSWAQVQAAIGKSGKIKGFALRPDLTYTQSSTIGGFKSANVVGVLPGSDPALAKEYVLLTAHLDHNGVNPSLKGDTIFNGAMDNAAGVATMIEAARAFVASGKPPKRSVMFVALTSEEDGLLGSDYIARHPVVPAGARVVADVNLDMPVLTYALKDVIAFGAEHSTIGEAVDRAARAEGLALSPDPMPEENIFVRSDHYSFVKQGVPSVMLATGFGGEGAAAFRGFLSTHYHKVSDDLSQPFNWQSAAKFASINYRIARDLADAPEAPRWYVGSPFGDQFAKDQPKAQKPN